MKITAQALTPLWTGGVETGKVDRIHETGILGSMRWWMEALVRGVGGDVIDPSQGQGSGFDEEKFERSQAPTEWERLRAAGLCDVSQLFGATGWRRRFRLEIEDQTQADTSLKSRIAANRSYTRKNGQIKTPTWYFPEDNKSKPRIGKLVFHIQTLHPHFDPAIIGGLIQFMADWSAIGARSQMGFGVIKIDDRIDTTPLYNWLKDRAGNKYYPSLPSLRNMFLARIEVPNTDIVHTFNLKYDLRRLFASDESLRHFVMGTAHGNRVASKIKVSHAYGDGNGIVRVWGWMPEQADQKVQNWHREKVIQTIYEHLRQLYKIQVWREFHSPRDTVQENCQDMDVFLKSLL